MTGGKIALLVTGIVVVLIGFGVAVGGGAMLWADSTQPGADGFLTSPEYPLQTDGYAVTAEEISLGGPSPRDWFPGDLQLRLEATAAEGGVFVGVAEKAEVARYLQGVAHDEVVQLGRRGEDDITYRSSGGDAVPAPPAERGFWQASAVGEGPQQLTWPAERGTWAVVVMNADGSPGVDIEASAGVRAGFLQPLGIVLLVGGLALLVIGVALIIVATRGYSAPTAATPGAAAPPVSGAGAGPVALDPGRRGSYPLTLEARLDEPLSRGLWLVKWLLLLPHFVVLGFLWTAFVVLTVAAGVAILFTGRYPRGIFDFNVGVLRWTWRVMYYGYSALGTDRYPPFTLADAAYPATLAVAYPEQLSRGLVLVKWWLLAIPHYLVVGLLAGGGWAWTTQDSRWGDVTLGTGGGIIGLLVVVAGIVVLFTTRYPRGLFDLVMGLNRWVYRVIAYAALLTDQYPPFRLDPGGPEPQEPPRPPTGGGPASDDAAPELVHS